MNITKASTDPEKDHLLSLFIEKRCSVKHCPFKRSFDICFSLAILALGFPIYLLIALLVKLDSSGPIFYGSLRVGRSGKIFTCWKFRSMYQDAEQKLASVLKSSPAYRKEWNRFHKLKQDPRVTKSGKWLRRTSLDELPQFWNVLKGDLSVVGPRPFFPEEVKRFAKDHIKIFSVRPGLTGLWQTSGRNFLIFKERIALEEKYVETRSFLLDLFLIIKTIPLMIFPKGAF